jgi:hypothetical protein
MNMQVTNEMGVAISVHYPADALVEKSGTSALN